MTPYRIAVLLVAAALVALPLRAQTSPPVVLTVDATQITRKLVQAQVVIPAKPGPLTLVYPKWIPGTHGPSNPINSVVGLKIFAGNRAIGWERDAEDLYAFRCDVPQGADSVTAEFTFLIPAEYPSFALTLATARLAVINWHSVLLYPQGTVASELPFVARLKLPEGWKYASALRANPSAKELEFRAVSLETLIDSPLLAGQFLRSIPLTEGKDPPYVLNLAADSPEALQIKPKVLDGYKRLPVEARAMLGNPPHRHYDFLVALSDEIPGGGLEHHQSSDNRMIERALLDEARVGGAGELLPHELTHSWNGKFRRPKGLATPDYQQAMHTELIWVYEGLTSYIGYVLAARSGLVTSEISRDRLAYTTASMELVPGRAWRSLHDTSVAAPALFGSPHEWRTWRRGTDFYPEGLLIWLEVDSMIRQKTAGRKTLDDFLHIFYGDNDGTPRVKPYELEDVAAALNQVCPNDWTGHFRARLDSTDAHAPSGGLDACGVGVVFKDTPSEETKAMEKSPRYAGQTNLNFSGGLTVKSDGSVYDVVRDSPADRAGLSPGMKIVTVNGRRFSADLLKHQIEAAKDNKQPIELGADSNQYVRTLSLDYHGGMRYPHLERDPAKPDLLAEILKSRATKAAVSPSTGPTATTGPAPTPRPIDKPQAVLQP
jgi:predicted metalloprotease with PDZ domain